MQELLNLGVSGWTNLLYINVDTQAVFFNANFETDSCKWLKN